MSDIDEIVRHRAATLASLPFDKAAKGCETSQRDIAAGIRESVHQGVPKDVAAFAAVLFGRLAASQGGPESAYVLGRALIDLASCQPLEQSDAIKGNYGEAIAWLQRAAAGGVDAADDLLTKMPITGEEDASDILAIAAALERVL